MKKQKGSSGWSVSSTLRNGRRINRDFIGDNSQDLNEISFHEGQ